MISQTLDLEIIFRDALSKTLEVTRTEAGGIYILEPDGKTLSLKKHQGISTELAQAFSTVMVGKGVSGMAVSSGKTVILDVQNYPNPDQLSLLVKDGILSIISTPLVAKGKAVGTLTIINRKFRSFSQEDLDLLDSIGSQIGGAVENARLYSESKKNLEKLQKAYEELQTLDKMKDEFMSNVSHELKTPLISIKGYGELLYDEKLGGRLDEQKKSLEAIIRNADRLTRLINSILFITRLQAGKIDFRIEPIEIEEIVQTCVEDLKNPMDRKRIIFEKEVSGVSRLRGDKDRFVEVISNLLDNAIKFTREDGKIAIKAWDELENVHITLSDNGIGIPEDIIPKLFTRFYQVDASTSRKYGGTGLGLYIAKTIVDALGGKIWIESEVGKGTTVHLLIPAAKEEH